MESILVSWFISLVALIGMIVYCARRKAGAEFFESFFLGLFLGLGYTAVSLIFGGEDLNAIANIPFACAVSGWFTLLLNLRRRSRLRGGLYSGAKTAWAGKENSDGYSA